MRTGVLLAAVVIVAAVAIVTPALGGSSGDGAQSSASTDQIARTALRVATSAQRQVANLSRSVAGIKREVASIKAAMISDLRVVDGPSFSVPPGGNTVDAAGLGNFRASCPNGYRVIGSGWEGDFGDMWEVRTYTFFVGGFGTNDASIPGDFQLQAICAKSRSLSRTHTGAAYARAERRYIQDNKRDRARRRVR